MDSYLVVGFAGVALTLIAVPAPDWAFILAAGARDHLVAPAVVGLMIGYSVLTAAIAVGVGPLSAAAPWALVILTLAGATYLIYLGRTVLRHSGAIERSNEDAQLSPPQRSKVMAKGIGISALNPKGLLIFSAILPQFTQVDQGWPIAAQLAVLGAVFTLICGAFYLALGYAAGRVLGARPRVARLTTQSAGVAMIIVGFVLVLERILAMTGD